jgi:hypothetical protein
MCLKGRRYAQNTTLHRTVVLACYQVLLSQLASNFDRPTGTLVKASFAQGLYSVLQCYFGECLEADRLSLLPFPSLSVCVPT